MYAHQCRSSHRAGRSHCHGNHFCIHSGTSRAGWHSGSGCGTQSGPLRTRRYLRTQTHTVASASVEIIFLATNIQLIWIFFKTFFDLCQLQQWRLIHSDQNRHHNSRAGPARLPTVNSQHRTQPEQGSVFLEITPVISFRALPCLVSSLIPPLLLALSLACGVHTHAQPRGVRSSLLSPESKSLSLSSIMYDVSPAPHLQLLSLLGVRLNLCTHPVG